MRAYAVTRGGNVYFEFILALLFALGVNGALFITAGYKVIEVELEASRA